MSPYSIPVPHVHVRLPAAPDAPGVARDRLVAFVCEHGGGGELGARTALAVTEAVANVVRHAYAGGDGWIDVEADIDDGLLEVVVADRGRGLRATPASDGLGAGLAIIADCCDDCTIRSGDGEGIEVWMCFALP
jgi:anti-sigma regulatory factor (Ser/Thr protein kinase)